MARYSSRSRLESRKLIEKFTGPLKSQRSRVDIPPGNLLESHSLEARQLDDKLRDALNLLAGQGTAISEEAALAVLKSGPEDMPEIMAFTSALRLKHHGSEIRLCSIVNAKSGACGEDCAFCAQSMGHNADVETYNLQSAQQIMKARDDASDLPIDHFGVVTSGCTLDDEGVQNVAEMVKGAPSKNVNWCASLGSLDEERLELLARSGLKRFHHNIETAESFFRNVCTTHSFGERLETVRRAKSVGLEVCCGGLLGLGESLEQRVELAALLAQEEIDSIPLNFLVPIEGTKLENRLVMQPLEILKCVAMFRFMNPKAEIKVCAGRTHLRDLQSMMFYAGATGMMIGDLLTVAGRDVATDLQMLEDLGMKLET